MTADKTDRTQLRCYDPAPLQRCEGTRDEMGDRLSPWARGAARKGRVPGLNMPALLNGAWSLETCHKADMHCRGCSTGQGTEIQHLHGRKGGAPTACRVTDIWGKDEDGAGAWQAAYSGLGSVEWGVGQAWRWPEPRVAGTHPPGSQMCPFGWSPLTVRASVPAARIREAWKRLGAGSREQGGSDSPGSGSPLWGIPKPTDRLSRPVLAGVGRRGRLLEMHWRKPQKNLTRSELMREADGAGLEPSLGSCNTEK